MSRRAYGDHTHGDGDHAGEQRLRKRRGKPQARRRLSDLHAAPDGDTPGVTFTDPSLQALHDMGLLLELIGELKSGKEATVYLARTPGGLGAVKLYRDLRARSFKNDGVYRDGRYVGDDRLEKAIRQRSTTGMHAQQALWVGREYTELWTLWNAGLNVPRPLVGPEPSECAKSGHAVLMQYIGNDDGPAPRLSDIRLPPDQARDAFDQSVQALADLLRLGRAHGDYSTYNLLWWQGRVVVIDLPQLVRQGESRHFDQLFERDVRSLCTSFARHGVRADSAATLRDVRKLARRDAPPVTYLP